MNNRIATYRLTISFLSYWFVSTGNEQGAYADQLALKDSEGFPYIPGKTIKGVFREAFRLAGNSGWFSDSENEHEKDNNFLNVLIQAIFGHDGTVSGFSEDELHTGGLIHVSNAELPENIKNQIGNSKSFLFRTIQNTAVDRETGTATNKSLRTSEVVIPFHLSTEVILDAPGDEVTGITRNDLDKIAGILPDVASIITEIGGKRRRGFGRCQCRMEKINV